MYGNIGGIGLPVTLLAFGDTGMAYTMGFSLASFKVRNAKKAIILTILHLALAVIVAIAVVRMFGFAGTERGVVILNCLMPSSVANYLVIDQYLPDEAPDVAGFILLSTLAALLVLPLALTYWI
jgi:hypothetical protein